MKDCLIPIVQVTLLEDRAVIRRQASLALKRGVERLRLRDVAPALVDKTLVAQWAPASGSVRTVHVRVDRYVPPIPTPQAEVPEPAGDMQRQRERERLQQQYALHQREAQSAANLYSELLQSISERVGFGDSDFEVWEQELSELEDWRRGILEEQCRLLDAIDALEAPFTPLPAPRSASRLHTDVVLEAECSEDLTATLTLEYSVPCACWRPYHRAVLEGSSLLFQSDGCCWQNTGEDWQDVQLVFSTQRSSLGSDPPALPVDRLGLQKKSQKLVVSEREVEIQELEAQPSGPASAEVPGIDDRGESIQLRSLTRATVPSHGRPVRVPIFEFQGEAQVEQVLMAELCPTVLQKSSQVNGSAFPLLAGPVDLVREGGHIGRTQLSFIGRGERFTLGWGPQASLRAVRHEEKGKEEKDDLLGGWVKVASTVSLSLSNLSTQSYSLTVVERVPVSEVKQVEVVVDTKSTSQGATPDAHGFVRWQVELGARQRHQLKLVYALRRRKEVVTT